MPLSSVVAALAIGISLGMLGGGGSILTVPALVYWVGLPPLEATASSLVVVGVTSVSGALQHARRGNLRWRAALAFAATAVPSAFLWSLAAQRIGASSQILLFAAIMIVAGVSMILRREYEPAGEVSLPQLLGAGLAVGLITGLVGIGGGFLIVPTLVLFARVSMVDAVGTSLAVIALNCASGLLGRLSAAATIPWAVTIGFSLVAVVGSFLGAALAPRVPVKWLRRAFGAFVIALAVFMIARTFQ